jgi:integrase
MGAYKKIRTDGSIAWYYNFSYKGKQYRAVGGTTRTQAQRTLERVRTEVINETYEHAREQNTKFEEVSGEFLVTSKTEKRSWKRDVQLVDHLIKFFKGKLLIQIKPADIELYKTNRKSEGVSGSTINRELAALKRIFYIAIKNKKAKYNPVTDVKFMQEPPGRTRYLNLEEINKLLTKCNDQVKPVVIVALNTGMRSQEILDLKWNNIFIENTINPYLEIEISKNGKKRFIPLNNTLITLFSDLKIKSDGRSEIFLNYRNQPLKHIRKQFHYARDKANINDVRFHDLRHTFASHYLMNGGDLLSLKQILGHSTLKMVERYAHLSQSHKLNMVNNLNFTDKNCHLSVTRKEKAI